MFLQNISLQEKKKKLKIENFGGIKLYFSKCVLK